MSTTYTLGLDASPFNAALISAQSSLRAFRNAISATAASIASIAAVKYMFSEALTSQMSEISLKNAASNAGIAVEEVAAAVDALQKKSGLSDEAIRNMYADLISMESLQLPVNQVAEMAVAMSKLGGTSLETAKNALQNVLNTGETRGLRQFGIYISENIADQVKALKAEGKNLAAQELLIGEVSKRTSGILDTLEGGAVAAWGRLSSSFGDLVEDLGTALSEPAGALVDEIAKMLNGTVVPIVKSVISWIKTNSDSIVAGIKAFGETVSATVNGILTVTGTVLGSVYSFVSGVIKDIYNVITLNFDAQSNLSASLKSIFEELTYHIGSVGLEIANVLLSITAAIEECINKLPTVLGFSEGSLSFSKTMKDEVQKMADERRKAYSDYFSTSSSNLKDDTKAQVPKLESILDKAKMDVPKAAAAAAAADKKVPIPVKDRVVSELSNWQSFNDAIYAIDDATKKYAKEMAKWNGTDAEDEPNGEKQARLMEVGNELAKVQLTTLTDINKSIQSLTGLGTLL